MAEEKEFTNHETYLVHKQLEEGDYKNNGLTEKDRQLPIEKLSEMIKADIEAAVPIQEGLFGDMLKKSMAEVNWQEITEKLVSDKG